MAKYEEILKLADAYDKSLNKLEDEAIARLNESLSVSFKRLSLELRSDYPRMSSEGSLVSLALGLRKYRDLHDLLGQILPENQRDEYERLFQETLNGANKEGIDASDRFIREIAPKDFPLDEFGGIPIEAVAAQAQDGVKRLYRYNAEFQTRASSVIEQGLVRGWALRRVQRQLQDELGVIKSKAETIARTEVMAAYNNAAKIRYKDAGLKYVTWLAVPSESLCIYCASRNGNTYPIDKVVYPLHPRDRCTLLPSDIEWRNAGLTDEDFLNDYHVEGIDELRARGLNPSGDKPAPFEKAAGLKTAPKPAWGPDKPFVIPDPEPPKPEPKPKPKPEPEPEPKPKPKPEPEPQPKPKPKPEPKPEPDKTEKKKKAPKPKSETKAKKTRRKKKETVIDKFGIDLDLSVFDQVPQVDENYEVKYEGVPPKNYREAVARSKKLYKPYTDRVEQLEVAFKKVKEEFKESVKKMEEYAKELAAKGDYIGEFDANSKIVDYKNKYGEFGKAYLNLQADVMDEVLSIVSSRGVDNAAKQWTDQILNNSNLSFLNDPRVKIKAEQMGQIFTDFYRLVGNNLAPSVSGLELERNLDGTPNYRAHANIYTTKTINVGQVLNVKDFKRVMFHEVGHFLEYEYNLYYSSMDFVNDHATSRTPKPLNEIIGTTLFGDDEIALEGDFIDPYVSKIYGERASATEVISMGLEHLADGASASKLYLFAPDHFHYIMGILR